MLDMIPPRSYRLASPKPEPEMDDKSKNLEATLAKMAHELRTPLAVVHTTTNMLLNPKYQFSEAQVREQHERIQRNVEVMNKLIGELSELAKSKPADGDGA
jgi:K+-sensing histidine kinase KdpD